MLSLSIILGSSLQSKQAAFEEGSLEETVFGVLQGGKPLRSPACQSRPAFVPLSVFSGSLTKALAIPIPLTLIFFLKRKEREAIMNFTVRGLYLKLALYLRMTRADASKTVKVIIIKNIR